MVDGKSCAFPDKQFPVGKKGYGQPFWSGTTNQILQMTKVLGTNNADQNLSSMPFTPTQTGLVSFDFYVASGGIEASTNRGFLLRMMSSIDTNFTHYDDSWAISGIFIMGHTNSTIVRKGTGNGSISTNLFAYNFDTNNSLSIAFNNSSGSYTYGTNSLASGKMDVWLNNSLMATWDLGQGTNAGVGNSLNGLWLQMPSAVTNGTILLDNIQVIPEPGTVALLMATMTGTLLFSCYRAKKRRG